MGLITCKWTSIIFLVPAKWVYRMLIKPKTRLTFRIMLRWSFNIWSLRRLSRSVFYIRSDCSGHSQQCSGACCMLSWARRQWLCNYSRFQEGETKCIAAGLIWGLKRGFRTLNSPNHVAVFLFAGWPLCVSSDSAFWTTGGQCCHMYSRFWLCYASS